MKFIDLIRLALCALAANLAYANDRLPANVAQALKNAGIPANAVGIYVKNLADPAPLLALNAQTPLNPASTMKLVTTYAALDLLGPAYAWQTEALIDGTLVDGVLNGNLYLRGGGDPKLTYEQFGRLLRQVRAHGVREIRGDLVLDRSAFAAVDVEPGRFDGMGVRPYNAMPDALLLNFKAVAVLLMPERENNRIKLGLEPAPSNLDVVNQLTLANGRGCGDWKERLRADIARQGETIRLTLSGSYQPDCGEQRWNIALPDTPQYVFGVFRQLWAELGGQFGGQVGGQVGGNWRESAPPADARSLATLPSLPLAEIVRDINKYSNNVMARQLFLTLAMESDEPRRPATAERAAATVRTWLAQRKLSLPELVLENGSGLSRRERISAQGLGRLLQSAWHSATMPELMSSLPVAATDGTMRKRLKQNGVAGQAHIKTGSLEGVKSIAGFVLDQNGQRWAVVFLVNHANAGAAQAAMDALLQWVWQGGRNPE
ncbi:MAG TPA: D-alanyl-D-alanine carboxypeptidase/D-alanyl-D-alanine-endopeptidase [Rhodocyclaceae bacterium]|nr:D-alanyl-D-alanine carboxypeptidase/D-alanyl-D-alanine-endopeptidase [Rhodocyclaceae bacterium]